MASSITVAADDLRQAVARIFAATGLPADDAAWAAYCLVEADLRGVGSHGISRIAIYTRRLREGLINPTPSLNVRSTAAVSAHIDGDNGMGYVIGRLAIDEAIARATAHGIGVVAASHSNHYGMSAAYMDRALAAGLASIVLTNASPAMPLWGGREPFLGTSPLAMAVPGGSQDIVLDMATSVAAKGKIRRALQRGETIPDGWAIDDQGKPTCDPEAALRGVVLPLGGPKGSGISLMIDVLHNRVVGCGHLRNSNHLTG